MTGRILLLAAFCGLAMPAHASECDARIPPEAEAKATKFLDLLVVGKGAEAVDAVVSDSALWSARAGIKEQMTGQIDTATKIYGPASRYEAYCGDALGTMAFREYYLVQHRETLTRWEFDFARTPSGWKIAYFGFTDQIQSWF